MKKFRVRLSLNEIEDFEVIKLTDKQVVYLNQGGRQEREAKTSIYYKWFDTKEQAKQHLIEVNKSNIIYHELRIEHYKKELAKVELL